MSPGDLQNLHSSNRNLVLTGFMDTGKTSVGRHVAQELGLPFVDMDVEIEARTGKSIPCIFAEDGEPTFRRMESALCQDLGARTGLVIATGGGALVDPANRAAMIENGTIVCLTCEPDELLARANRENSDRPLLEVADPGTEIKRLLALRWQAYAAIPWKVDTTGLPVGMVAERVLQFADFVTLPVRHPGGEYPIHVGEGLLDHLGSALQAAGIPAGGCVAVVSNPAVAALYGARVEESLHLAGFRPVVCSVADGEQHKDLASVASLYDQFLAGGLDRTSLVLSLGGGVTGDIAGFAAATFMRGVRFAQVPTTILSMADASVGGKTGVDFPQGKNLAGAFKQPELVAIDPSVLTTLPEEEIRSGMAEVIKHGVIGDPELFAELESPPPKLQSPISVSQLARTLGVKIAVVEQDPFEQGWRAVLNLGHTVGHGLERLSGYSLRHGEAVSIGMVAAARIAAALGIANADLATRIESALDAWGLPVRCPPHEVGAIWEAMTHDKKRRGRALRWILPRAIGQVEIVEDVAPSVVKYVLQDLGARRSE